MDRQAWIAVTLCIIALVLWEIYNVRHPQPTMRRVTATPSASAGASAASNQSATASPNESTTAAPTPSPTATATPAATPVPFAEKTAALRNNDLVLRLTNRGGGIAEAVLPKHKAENGQPLKLNALERVPIGAIVDQPAAPQLHEFKILPAAQGQVEFERALPNDVTLRKTFTLPNLPNERDNYLVQMAVDYQNHGKELYANRGDYIALGAAGPLHKNDLASYTRVTWCIGGKAKYTDVSWFGEQNYPFIGVQKRAAQEYFNEQVANAEWAGVSNQFFVTLITPLNATATSIWATRFEAGKTAKGAPDYAIEGAMGMPGFQLAPGQTKTLKFQLYVGPKLYHKLAELSHDEAEIMDFGLWKWICEALLNMMNLIHRFVGNYAIAILILTALIRLVLWPIQTKSYKSMRRMSALAPKMQELREKYKDDPTKMNAEVMKLYKTYGVNPVSGCLPMLIQIPIFFGLFTMLRQAVELRNASFLWVKDLSQPDTVAHLPLLGWPINILPLLMAATQLWLMRLTPKSGDATQQKLMMFMPLVFVVFCYNFAAALALYYTVQNLFMIVQTYQNRHEPQPTLEKVNPPGRRKGKGRR